MSRRTASTQINFRVAPSFAREITKAAKLLKKSVGQLIQETIKPVVDKTLMEEANGK